MFVLSNSDQIKKEKKTESSDFFRELQMEFLIHELKDPVSVIETGIRTLLEKKEKYGELSARQEKTLKRTLRNTRKVRDMLYNLLEIGRSQADCINCISFHPVNVLYDVLTESLEIMAIPCSEHFGEYQNENDFLNTCGIFFHREFDAEIFQDETRFRQITGNLIKNALYYRKEQIEIRIKSENEHLFVEVTDDGPGISPEHHQLIFKRYSRITEKEHPTLRRRSHGLGLAGSLILARSLGGDIELESRKGEGAIFRLIIPVKR